MTEYLQAEQHTSRQTNLKNPSVLKQQLLADVFLSTDCRFLGGYPSIIKLKLSEVVKKG